MKAQILKIAGVKTEAEFYKKYPTEEAFMKKHGKELKKAQVGASLKTTGSLKPQGLSSSAKALPTLTSPVAASTGAFNQSVDGADFFGNTASNYGYNPNAYIPSPNENSGNSFKSKMQEIGSKIKQGMEESTKEADLSVDSGLAGMIGGIASGISTINQTKKNIKELGKYGKISDVAATAATSRPERSRRMYVRPEDNLVMAANPLGKPSSLLAAQNGAEIANTFAPNTIYTDMGYEPLNDSDKVKAFKKGGKIKKAEIGAMIGMANSAADLSRASGQIGGLLGSQWGGAGGETGGYSQALGGFGLVGGIAGGLLDAPMLKKQKQAQNHINNNLALTNMQSGMNSPHMENGGWMNPEYNPQVIAKFGEYSMDQLLAPPHDADMLRAGGHLKEYTPPSARAMYTGRDLPYQMEHGGQMAMGGDLEVHRGEAETLSYNPFLPDGGETIMFRGPSHDNGGMPISFGQNGVEVEGGEPAVKLQDGGSPDGNLVVFGNMVIPNYGVAELGDDKAKGKKFKHYVDDLSKIEAKQNKLVDKTTQLIDNVDVNDQFDKLTLNTGQANLIGTSMKLKDIAEKKKTAAAVQNAILDTASEMGVESDALAKGKIKYAKANDPYAEFGTKLQKGGKASKYDPEFENFIDQAMMLEQVNSSDALKQPDGTFLGGVYRGGASNYGTGSFSDYNTPDKAKEFYYKEYWSKVKDLPAGLRTRALQMAINTGDPYGELMVAAGKMGLDERRNTLNERKDKAITGNKTWEKNKADILKAYKEDPQAFLGKLDAEQDRYYNSYIANNPSSVDSNTRKEFFDDYTGLARYASQPYISNSQSGISSAPPSEPVASMPSGASASAIPTPVKSSATSPTELWQIPKAERKAIAIANGIKNYSGTKVQNEKLMNILNQSASNPIMNPGTAVSANANVPVVGINNIQKAAIDTPSPLTKESKAPEYEPVKKSTEKEEKGKFPWDTVMMGVNSVLPFVRPSNQMTLDPSQLSGEMYAMSQNQEEPVFAQSYQPMLSQPISISLQDQINEITAQTNASKRLAQNNPSVLPMIDAQFKKSVGEVLGEQFRMNQGEAQRVAETNRQTINEATKTNIGLFDQQQQRQSQARSNTKMQNITALNSISDKIAKNKLENRQLAISENLYNYRFTPNGVAYNINPAQNFNISGTGKSTDGVAPEGYEFYKAMRKKGTSKNDDAVISRNGSIVKSIKNL